jgi:hypothetical protein
MAAGDIDLYINYKQSLLDIDAGLSGLPVDWDADTLRVAVMNATFTPDLTSATSQLHWSDVSTNQVATATAYTGPIALATLTVSETGGVVSVDADDVTINQDAGGFTDGRRLVFYKDTGTASTSPLIAVGDLGSNKGIQAGPLEFQWHADGLLTLS